MISKIVTKTEVILNREDLEWQQIFQNFVSCKKYENDTKLLEELKVEYQLGIEQIEGVSQILNKDNLKSFSISGTKETFKIAPIFLEFKNIEGKILYWKDWDYVFQEIENEYYLWCYVGGIADIQREIKLSEIDKKLYQNNGFEHILYLINDLKLVNSIEHKKAVIEKRCVIY